MAKEHRTIQAEDLGPDPDPSRLVMRLSATESWAAKCKNMVESGNLGSAGEIMLADAVYQIQKVVENLPAVLR